MQLHVVFVLCELVGHHLCIRCALRVSPSLLCACVLLIQLRGLSLSLSLSLSLFVCVCVCERVPYFVRLIRLWWLEERECVCVCARAPLQTSEYQQKLS